MHTIADTKALAAEGVITQAAARLIETRARSTMVALAINTLLCAGVLFATFGLIFWLADAVLVAVFGVLMLLAGCSVLRHGTDIYAMFGNAAALIGAGMLLGGAGFEMIDKYPEIAGWVLGLGGALVAAVTAWFYQSQTVVNRFVSGAILLIAAALHLVGLGQWLQELTLSGMPVHVFWLYAAALIACAGWFVDLRVISALAIVPFAQALDTSTLYFHAAYVFYSPESTLSILQMTAVIGVGLGLMARNAERLARHARIHVMMAFVVANLCALVGSLWGDVVGQHVWGPVYRSGVYNDYDTYREAAEAFRATAVVINADVYSVLWAAVLATIAFFAAHKNLRGLFNAAVTFAAIHAYTQAFETFYDEPLAYVIGGFIAIPLAWGMWRLNARFLSQTATQD
ncbi:MAG: hypothetical protein AB8B62_02675 [Roseobacter sp.]